jgi:hypothetical protein
VKTDIPNRAVVPVCAAVIAIIHAGALLVAPEGTDVLTILVLEGITGVAVTVAFVAGDGDWLTAIGAGAAVAAVAVVAWTLPVLLGGVGPAALAVLLIGTLASYLIHRYELLTLGLLEETP